MALQVHVAHLGQKRSDNFILSFLLEGKSAVVSCDLEEWVIHCCNNYYVNNYICDHFLKTFWSDPNKFLVSHFSHFQNRPTSLNGRKQSYTTIFP